MTTPRSSKGPGLHIHSPCTYFKLIIGKRTRRLLAFSVPGFPTSAAQALMWICPGYQIASIWILRLPPLVCNALNWLYCTAFAHCPLPAAHTIQLCTGTVCTSMPKQQVLRVVTGISIHHPSIPSNLLQSHQITVLRVCGPCRVDFDVFNLGSNVTAGRWIHADGSQYGSHTRYSSPGRYKPVRWKYLYATVRSDRSAGS